MTPPGNDDRTILEMQRDATEPIILETPPVATSSRPLIEDEEPDRPPFRERLGEWRRHYFPLPDEVVEEYLGEDEYVVHTDHPSFRAFLIQNIILVLVVSIAGPTFVFMVRGGFDWTTVALFFAIDIVLLYMAIKRLQDRYISYVITNLRLIRLAGIFGRRLNSIPWTRMTGLGYFQKPMGRILGYATVFIESANEESGLRSFSNINDPATFHQRILDMVSSKTGQSAGGKIPPPTKGERKSIFQKRRERRGKGGALRASAEWPTINDEDPDSGARSSTDVAGAYAAATGDDKPSDGSKQGLGTKGKGKGRSRGGGRIPDSGRGGRGGGSGPGGGRPGGPSGRGDGPGSQKRRPQMPPSARRRQPPPPAPTNPWGDPEPAAFRTSDDAQRRKPRMRDEEGLAAPSDLEAEGRRSDDEPHAPTRPSQGLPRSRRPAPKRAVDREGDPDDQAGLSDPAARPDDQGPDDDGPRGGGIPSVDPPPRPPTPPRGSARIRPGEPRTPAGGTSAVGSPSEPGGPRRPQQPPSRRTPPGGTGAVRPGEPRPRSKSSPSDTPAPDSPQEGPAAGPQAHADLDPSAPPRRRRADVRHETAPDEDVAAMAAAPVFDPTDDDIEIVDVRTPVEPLPAVEVDRSYTPPQPQDAIQLDEPDDTFVAEPEFIDDPVADADAAVEPEFIDDPVAESVAVEPEVIEPDPAEPVEAAVAEPDVDDGPEAVVTAEPEPDVIELRPEPEVIAADSPTPQDTVSDEAQVAAADLDIEDEPEAEDEVVVEAEPEVIGVETGEIASEPRIEAAVVDEVEDEDEPDVIGVETGRVGEPAPDGPPPPPRRRQRPARDEAPADDEPQLSSEAKSGDTFTPPKPRTPPSSRRQASGRTPAGGTPAARPRQTRPTSGAAAGPAARTAPTDDPRPHRGPRPPRPPRRLDEDDSGDETTDAAPAGWSRLSGGKEPAPRRSRLFGRRFPWSRRPDAETEEDDEFDGSARDAVGFVRPPGFARRTAQSFRRPRVSMSGRRRSIFPPGRELPAGEKPPPAPADIESDTVAETEASSSDPAPDTGSDDRPTDS